MKKAKLLPLQLETVSNWMRKRQGAEIRQIIDRSCRYRDAYILWEEELKQPDGSLDIIFFETRLELTPSGKIRVEESENKRVYTLSNNHSCLLPLKGIKFISLTPKRIEKLSFYSKDRSKSKVAKIKPEQLELPLTKTGIILQEASFRSGDKRVKSLQ